MNRLGASRGILMLSLVPFSLIMTLAGRAEQPHYWQLTFSYDSNSLSLLEARRIPDLRKQVQTPGLRGSAWIIAYKLIWVGTDAGEILSTKIEVPIGIRTVMGETSPCQTILPSQGILVVRAEGPVDEDQPKAIRLIRTGTAGFSATSGLSSLPPAFAILDITLPLTRFSSTAPPPPGPISATKVRDTGDDRNRLVIVVLGDGYTSANLAAERFSQDVTNFVSAFGGKSPWDIYFAGTNIYRVDIESRQEGADEPPRGIYVDTYLNTSFWARGIEYLLTLDTVGTQRAIQAANSLVGVGIWDHLFVLVNSTKYGGSGGTIAVSSVHSAASEIALHEFGHSFAGLADEYETGGSGLPSTDSEPNVDFHVSGQGLKWLVWVEAGTPLPTPETSQYANVVGAFEGAKYYPTGIYRPWYDCLMRTLGRTFCPVCKESHAVRYMQLVDLLDVTTPPLGSVQHVGPAGVRFAARPIPITPLSYEWRIGGGVIPGATSYTLTVTPGHLPSASATLELRVAHPTSLVRRYNISRTYQWLVEGRPAAISPNAWRVYR
jgi:hypothetical protein